MRANFTILDVILTQVKIDQILHLRLNFREAPVSVIFTRQLLSRIEALFLW